jgi:sulfate adenylyltransferase
MMERYQDRLEIQMVPIREMSYSTAQEKFMPVEQLAAEGTEGITFTDRDLRQHLEHNLEIPRWYSYPEVVSELRKVFPPRNRKGLTLFFTGLSGSGKSTLAKIMYAKFIEEGHRPGRASPRDPA